MAIADELRRSSKNRSIDISEIGYIGLGAYDPKSERFLRERIAIELAGSMVAGCGNILHEIIPETKNGFTFRESNKGVDVFRGNPETERYVRFWAMLNHNGNPYIASVFDAGLNGTMSGNRVGRLRTVGRALADSRDIGVLLFVPLRRGSSASRLERKAGGNVHIIDLGYAPDDMVAAVAGYFAGSEAYTKPAI